MPGKISAAQTIPNEPVKYAQKQGWVNPILANLPVPTSSGLINFCITSDKNIIPTTMRIMTTDSFGFFETPYINYICRLCVLSVQQIAYEITDFLINNRANKSPI